MRYIGKKCLMILMCIGILTGCGSGKDTAVYLEEERQQEVCDTQQVSEMPEEEKSVTVYVCGAVRKPGVYTLASGLRLADAVDAAGGFKKSASKDAWNLAEKLTDGSMYSIPTKAEAKSLESTETGKEESAQPEDGHQYGRNRGTYKTSRRRSGACGSDYFLQGGTWSICFGRRYYESFRYKNGTF